MPSKNISKADRKGGKLNIVFASSEVFPFAWTGGLGEVVASLSQTLSGRDHTVTVIMPLYRSVMEKNFPLKNTGLSLQVTLGTQILKPQIFTLTDEKKVPVYFIRHDEFYDRNHLYGTPQGDYSDNGERFIFFNRASLELMKHLGRKVDILHCNDWHTALLPAYVKSIYKENTVLKSASTVFTIHNLSYQGLFHRKHMGLTGLPSSFYSQEGLEYYGRMNLMKAGILFADAVTTVSKKYAQEIQTCSLGCGLEGVIRERNRSLWGILNGVDYTRWNPQRDPYLAASYDRNHLEGKRKCKEDLMEAMGLKTSSNLPLLGMISRLVEQKGLDLLLESLEELMESEVCVVILGNGEEKYERPLKSMEKKYKSHLKVRIGFDNSLAHKIEAGSDMYLMPSLFEPCGLNQMYSLKYGTIPIVRATGGLDDSVQEFNPQTGEGTGFKFKEYSASAFIEKVLTALQVYKEKDLWWKLIRNAMDQDFSWEKAAREYEKVYRGLTPPIL